METLPALAVPLIFTNLVNLMLSLMVVFVFATIVPGVMLGVVCSNKKVMNENVMGQKWRAIYWLMLGVVVLTGILTVPALLGLSGP